MATKTRLKVVAVGAWWWWRNYCWHSCEHKYTDRLVLSFIQCMLALNINYQSKSVINHNQIHFSTFLCLSLLLISVSPDEEECFPWKFVNTIFQCCTKTSNHFHHHNCTILKPDRVQLVNGSNLIKALKFIQNIILSWATTSQPHSLMYP